jgi:hypothetical protein
MIAAAHVTAGMVGGVAALSARGSDWRFATALGLGVLSHVVLDAIPHSDYGSLARETVLTIVSLELLATFTFGWFLLRRPRLPGLRLTLPTALAGAMVPDAKFAGPLLPAPAAQWLLAVGDRFHAPFHAAPTPVAVGLVAEIVCTLLLLGALTLVLRRQHRMARVRQASSERRWL